MALRQFVNCTDTDWPLVLAWLVAAFRPRGPYPILALLSDRGSGKSTTARVLRSLIDPNQAPLRSEPKEPRDLMISATNSWVFALDNLSKLLLWLSDAMCRLSTGGGFATRSLFTNDEEVIFEAQRPAIVTAIGDVIARSDLLDRSVIVVPPAIDGQARMAENEFWKAFAAAHPLILGAIFDVIVAGLAALPSVELSTRPRMADFAVWASACEQALGLERGTFMRAYTRSQEAALEVAIDANSAAALLRDHVLGGNRVEELTASDLLNLLNSLATESIRRSPDWPKSPSALSNRLHRATSDLRSIGVSVRFGRSGKARTRVLSASKVDAAGAPARTPPPEEDAGGRRSAVGRTASEASPSTSGMPLPPGETGLADAADAADGDFPTVDAGDVDARAVASESASPAASRDASKIAETPSASSAPSASRENVADGVLSGAVRHAADAVRLADEVPAASDGAGLDESEVDL